ncbi:hypothetical protein, partial [Bacteroides heparinolyticus]|uniref:hypothetical protein n=1 Tax=Prevotella heparinolytica TaxID=28113 RepID=UPI0035A1C122
MKPEARRRVGHGELLPPHFIGRNTSLRRSQYLTSSVAIPHFVGRNPTLYGLQSRTLLAVTPHFMA